MLCGEISRSDLPLSWVVLNWEVEWYSTEREIWAAFLQSGLRPQHWSGGLLEWWRHGRKLNQPSPVLHKPYTRTLCPKATPPQYHDLAIIMRHFRLGGPHGVPDHWRWSNRCLHRSTLDVASSHQPLLNSWIEKWQKPVTKQTTNAKRHLHKYTTS